MPTKMTPHGLKAYCPNCGHYVKSNATVCKYCHHPLNGKDSPSSGNAENSKDSGSVSDGGWFSQLSLVTKVIILIAVFLLIKFIIS